MQPPSYCKHRSHAGNNFQTYPGVYEQRTLNYSQGFMAAEDIQAESNGNFSSDYKKKLIIRSLVLRTSM